MVETYKPSGHAYILIMDGGRPALFKLQVTGKVGTAKDLIGYRDRDSHVEGRRP